MFTLILAGVTVLLLGLTLGLGPIARLVPLKPSAEDAATRTQEHMAILWLVLLALLVWLFGFLAGLPVYSLLHVRKRSHEGWPVAAAISGGILVITYGLSFVLQIRLFEGQVSRWF